MGISVSGIVLITLACLVSISISTSTPSSTSVVENVLKCIYFTTNHSNSTANNSHLLIFHKNTSSYTSVLRFSAQNLRFLTHSTHEPEFIIRPKNESQIQAAVICSRKYGMEIRVRSGGHDYEGLSYASNSNVPFIIVDLSDLRSIKIDMEKESAWVESGATLGEVYHEISKKSRVLGFPAGSCPTVGVGGHFSGGGFGTIFRKYGLAADNVIDAKIVDANGRIVDRRLMGEDVFWCIRGGGGGASFGIIFAWKIKLVPVPSLVTVFEVQRTLDQGATGLLCKWQALAHKLHEDLFLHATVGVVDSSNQPQNKTIIVSFAALYLGRVEKLITLLKQDFPELGVERSDCTEMSWIQSVLYFAGFSISESHDVLLNRTQRYKSFFKAKSDYVTEPIPERGLQGLWKILLEDSDSYMIMTPYGGKMSAILGSEIAFPHRNGILYGIQYMVSWENEKESEKHMKWIRRLYGYMKSYVSKSPRCAYINYRDLDLGINNINGYSNNTSYAQGSVWGFKYFKDNFERLAHVKTKVDPTNFFRNEQSIPLFHV